VQSFFALSEVYEHTLTEKRQRASKFIEELLAKKITLPYSHMIIDEGQDFDEEWLSALETSVPGKFFVYYDKSQMVHKDASALPQWLREAECRLVLKNNCRNTKQIAITANSFIRIENLKFKNEIEGPEPIWIECEMIEIYLQILFPS
jgi:superfamily I DNA/RNA helicase